MSDIKPLDDTARRGLLDLARQSILSVLQRGALPDMNATASKAKTSLGVFVTLNIDGVMRGCIGKLEGDGLLEHDVMEMAAAAATQDERFEPLTAAEVRHTEIELTLIGRVHPIWPDDVVVGTHGLYLVKGRHRAVILPQVAVQEGWDAPTFLKECARRAGLDAEAYTDKETMVFAFTAQVFSDATVAP